MTRSSSKGWGIPSQHRTVHPQWTSSSRPKTLSALGPGYPTPYSKSEDLSLSIGNRCGPADMLCVPEIGRSFAPSRIRTVQVPSRPGGRTESTPTFKYGLSTEMVTTPSPLTVCQKVYGPFRIPISYLGREPARF